MAANDVDRNRIMNIQEKRLIEAFLDTGNAALHNKAVELLFYGRKGTDANGRTICREFDVTRAIKNAVSIYYSGSLYAGRQKEVYDTFVSLFHAYLLKLNPDKLRGIDNLQNWMFRVAKNFANSHRREVNELLGIEDNVVGFSMAMDVDNREETGCMDSRSPEDGEPYTRKIPEKDNDADSSSEHTSTWAEELIAEYISRIAHPYYRELLYAVDVNGMAMEDFAEEQGKRLSAVHNDHKRAMSALIQAALPDIRWRAPKLYESFRFELNDAESEVLERFFYHNIITDMPRVIKAYVKLLKIAKRDERMS